MQVKDHRARHATLMASLALVLPQCAPPSYQSPSPPSLAPDLNVGISCLEEHDSAFEESASKLLQSTGFDPLNVSRLRREHLEPNRATRVYAVELVGLTPDRNAMASLIRLSNVKDEFIYDVTLFTRPPTTRAHNIETSLEQFAVEFAKSPTCHVAGIQRNQNEADSSELFDEIYAIKRGWFKQANEIDACLDAGGIYDHETYICRRD